MTFWKMIFLLQNCILRFHVIFFAGCSLENATSLFVGSILAARQIYEKRLIEKHISDSGQCPVTKEELHEEKLTALRVTIFRFWNLGVLSWFRFLDRKRSKFCWKPTYDPWFNLLAGRLVRHEGQQSRKTPTCKRQRPFLVCCRVA